jgi:hypothetical protein
MQFQLMLDDGSFITTSSSATIIPPGLKIIGICFIPPFNCPDCEICFDVKQN